MSKDGTDYYTISNNYLESLKNTGTDICFLDYDNPVAESKNCHGIVLPGGAFDIGKRFQAYKDTIKNAHKDICQCQYLNLCCCSNGRKYFR